MPDTSDRVGECVHVLRAMGVSLETVTDRYGATGEEPVEALTAALSDTSDRRLYDLLHESVARSDRGIECPRAHDLATAEAALGEALERYDCTLAVDNGDPITLEATDGAGETRTATVSLPPTLPDGDPLPALAGAVDRHLLDGTGLTLVLLTEREDAWRLALLPERRLTDLQSRLGVRLSVFGRALLCADQPPAFLDGRARAYAAAPDGGVVATGPEPNEPAPDGPSVEGPVEADRLGDGRHEHAEPRPPADAETVERLLADLSATLEADPDDRDDRDDDADASDPTAEVGGGPTRAVGEGVDDVVARLTGDAGAEPFGGAFDAVERAAGREDEAAGGPRRVVADESVDELLSEVGVVEPPAEDVDLDEALSSMAGEFDSAPSLPEPLAAATEEE